MLQDMKKNLKSLMTNELSELKHVRDPHLLHAGSSTSHCCHVQVMRAHRKSQDDEEGAHMRQFYKATASPQ